LVLAKSIFQVRGVDETGVIVSGKRLGLLPSGVGAVCLPAS